MMHRVTVQATLLATGWDCAVDLPASRGRAGLPFPLLSLP